MRKPLSAYDKLIDYLSRRDHSEFELRNKLLQKGFADAEIDEALEKVKTKGFLAEPQELAEKAADALHRKLKGILYIQEYLKSKNLPTVGVDWEFELEKAEKLAHKQFRDQDALFRFLSNRGFAESTIDKVVNKR